MAKRFQFRVEAVLKMRRQAERLAMRKMADAQRKVADIENSVRDLQRRLAEQDELVRRGVLTGTVDVTYMSLYRRHVMALHRRIIGLGHELREAMLDLARQRAKATEAIKQRKVLSTLKDKMRTRYLEGLQRAEQHETDDMNLMRIGHTRTEQPHWQ